MHKKNLRYICVTNSLWTERLWEELALRKSLASESETLALHQYIPPWLISRGAKIRVNVVEGEELKTDTPSNVPFSISVPFGCTHSMTGLSLRSCAKITLQVRLRGAPTMEEPEPVIVTSGGSLPIFTQDDEIMKTDQSTNPSNMWGQTIFMHNILTLKAVQYWWTW